MKTILVALTLAVMFCGLDLWIEEAASARGAAFALAAGDPVVAYQRYSTLLGRRLVFLNRPELTLRREGAAAAAIPALVHARDFAGAAASIQVVLAGPESGHEAEARAARRRLPFEHIDYIGTLVEQHSFEQGLEEVRRATEEYRDWPRAQDVLRGLRATLQVGLAAERTAEGDPQGAIAALREFERGAPIATLRVARDSIAHAIVQRSTEFERQRLFAEWLEWADATRTSLALEPELADAAGAALAALYREAFALPLVGRRLPNLDVRAMPAVQARGPAPATGMATLVIANRTNAPLIVMLRGKKDYQSDPVPPGGSVAMIVRAGKYAQSAHAGAGPAPFLGIVDLAEAEYAQEFRITPEHRAMTAAPGEVAP